MIRRHLYSFALSASLVPIFCSCTGSSSPPKVQPSVSQSEPNGVLRSAEEDRQDVIANANANTNDRIERVEEVIPSTSVPATTIASDVLQEQPQPPATPAKRADIYNTSADATADVAAAIARAKRDNKRVLVMYGGNWCGWCYKLHDVFEKNREIATPLRNEYERVMVDVGHFDKNMELATSYGADLKAHGVPFLTVLDADGRVLANQDTGELEDGPAHDTQKVRDFIEHWMAEPLDAKQVLTSALARAKDEGKLLFVHLGAPWCGWCHRLEHFLDENGSLFERDYILVKIDTDRMTHGKSVAEELRGTSEGGIPWIAILDATGDKLTTSDGPAGNIGYPAEPQEIEHFIKMLRATAKVMSSEQISQIQLVLTEAAKKYLAR